MPRPCLSCSALLLALLLASCLSVSGDPLAPPGSSGGKADGFGDEDDSGEEAPVGTWRDVPVLPAGSCEHTWGRGFAGPPAEPAEEPRTPGGGAPRPFMAEDEPEDEPFDEAELPWHEEEPAPAETLDAVAHMSSRPLEVTLLRPKDDETPELRLPSWDDDLPLFDRARAWGSETRCYETPLGAMHLTEALAYELYVEIAESTTGVSVDATPGVRTVVGFRGAYPGAFVWHGNEPNRWNDTLVLLWIDDEGAHHVREFPATTEPGAHDFGYHNSSALRPNRRYVYENSYHTDYDALRIAEEGYEVRDDTNNNGHWDSDRDGWLPPGGSSDHFRSGSLHNIHGNGVDPGLDHSEDPIEEDSAGCQVIPGTASYREFISRAWTERGDRVQYFLIDARDVAPEVFRPCVPDGSHACPYRIASFPFEASGDTRQSEDSVFDRYNCASSNESGPEDVYVFTVDRKGTLTISVDCEDGVDVDIQLLDGDDPNACMTRHDRSLSRIITPGRYFVVIDTYVNRSGDVLSGEYELGVTLR